jgi:broad specificity phosphatase PhoE
MTRLILCRHGETDWNVEGRYQGQADPPLNANGLAQARDLASELQQVGLEVIYSSPLRRALQTAEIVAEGLRLPLFVEPRLMEIHQGDWQTRLRAEINARYPDLFWRWQTEPWAVTPPGGESIIHVQERVYAGLDDLLEQHQGRCIGLVTHRIPIALIKLRYQDLPPDVVRTIDLPNTYWEEIQLRPTQEKQASTNQPPMKQGGTRETEAR